MRLRSIQAQLIASFLLFEVLALALFTGLLVHERQMENDSRITRRLEYQSATIAALSRTDFQEGTTARLQAVVSAMLHYPAVERVSITRPGGLVLASSRPGLLGTVQHTQWDGLVPNLSEARILRNGSRIAAVVAPVRVNSQLVGFVWLVPSASALRVNFGDMLRATVVGALAVLLACTLLAAWLARSISKPLTRLLAATRRMVRDPRDTSAFPLAVRHSNETSDLIIACNLMVAAIEEQRGGLNNTLSLLDSMLANAPIGVAFFDREGSFVRVNQFLADMQGKPVSFHLGRRLEEVFAPGAAAQMRQAVAFVFDQAEAVRDLEVHEPDGAGAAEPSAEQGRRTVPEPAVTWLMNVYPVRSAGGGVRWAGALIVDISNRLRAEEALRKSEKLAAAGRLAASIAHEINNPLEAVTNLLYLLEHYADLSTDAKAWVIGAQHEVSRVSAITQQTLRFHRQSTRPQRTQIEELLDSVLTLHQGRVNTLQVQVVRRFGERANLVCLSGELRQLFANLVGNALDAMQPHGGRLLVCARGATDLLHEGSTGVRVTVADTGSGMSREVRERIFEPFFTTKEATGTGLGLWVGAEIMEKHGVRLHVRSREAEPGAPRGTVFSLFFPQDYVTGERPS